MRMKKKLASVNVAETKSWMFIWSRTTAAGRWNSTGTARYAWITMRIIVWWCCYPATIRFIDSVFMNGSWTQRTVIWRALFVVHLFTSRIIDSIGFKFLNAFMEQNYKIRPSVFYLNFYNLKAISCTYNILYIFKTIMTFKFIYLRFYFDIYLINKKHLWMYI